MLAQVRFIGAVLVLSRFAVSSATPDTQLSHTRPASAFLHRHAPGPPLQGTPDKALGGHPTPEGASQARIFRPLPAANLRRLPRANFPEIRGTNFAISFSALLGANFSSALPSTEVRSNMTGGKIRAKFTPKFTQEFTHLPGNLHKALARPPSQKGPHLCLPGLGFRGRSRGVSRGRSGRALRLVNRWRLPWGSSGPRPPRKALGSPGSSGPSCSGTTQCSCLWLKRRVRRRRPLPNPSRTVPSLPSPLRRLGATRPPRGRSTTPSGGSGRRKKIHSAPLLPPPG